MCETRLFLSSTGVEIGKVQNVMIDHQQAPKEAIKHKGRLQKKTRENVGIFPNTGKINPHPPFGTFPKTTFPFKFFKSQIENFMMKSMNITIRNATYV